MSQALNDTVSENNIKNTENIENIENIESTEHAESSENSVAKKKKKIGFHPKRFFPMVV